MFYNSWMNLWFCEAFPIKSLVQLDNKCFILVIPTDELVRATTCLSMSTSSPYISGRKGHKHRRDTMGVSGYLKSIEHVWETLRTQVDLPVGAASPLQSNPCKVGHGEPPWGSDPSSWRHSGFSASDNTCRYFNIQRTVKSRTFVNSCLGDRGEWRPLPFFMSMLQLLASLCSQLTKQQRKTKEERRPVSASARDWEARDYSLQLQASSWATSAGRVFLLARKSRAVLSKVEMSLFLWSTVQSGTQNAEGVCKLIFS